MASIHTFLKEIRVEKGLTQEEVADRIGLTRQAISAYEAGKRQPGIDILMKLAEVYEVSIESLLYGKGESRGRRRVSRGALIAAAVFLGLQLLTGLFSTLSFVLYPVEEGPVSAEQMEVVEKHFEMARLTDSTERLAAAALKAGAVVVLCMDLWIKPAIPWKRKVTFYLAVLGLSWLIALLWGAVHPAFTTVDFVLRGPFHFVGATALLLLDLALTAPGKRKRGQC